MNQTPRIEVIDASLPPTTHQAGPRRTHHRQHCLAPDICREHGFNTPQLDPWPGPGQRLREILTRDVWQPNAPRAWLIGEAMHAGKQLVIATSPRLTVAGFRLARAWRALRGK